MATELSRNEFFGMAGLTNESLEATAYTPVSLGKGNEIRDGNKAWIRDLRHIDFIDSDQLRTLTPEKVTATSVIVNEKPQPNFKAIVGDVTGKVYSIKSNKYQIAQNQLLVDALASASENTGIQVFGKMSDYGGRMAINSFFADPDCNVDFGEYRSAGSDPYMLGVRAYNSHTGQTGFGAEIIGVRWLCSNMVAFGDVLGRVSWKHFVTEDKIADMISSMIMSYMDKVPILKDRITAMNNEVLTLDEAECALWGIKVSPFQTEGIMANLSDLNPEVRHKNGKISVYDLFNATTAYNTYANTGRGEFGRTDFSHKAQKFVVEDIQELVDSGADDRLKWQESQIKMNSQNTQLVAY